jgi:hypothetical protein
MKTCLSLIFQRAFAAQAFKPVWISSRMLKTRGSSTDRSKPLAEPIAQSSSLFPSVEERLLKVERNIDKVAASVEQVGELIVKVGNKIKESDSEQKKALMDKEKALMDEKKALMDKEKALMDKEKALVDQKIKREEEEKALKTQLELEGELFFFSLPVYLT